MKRILIITLAVGLLASCGQKDDFAPREIDFSRDVCFVCYMGLTDQRYNVQAINQWGEVHWYDDIGCLAEEMRGVELWSEWKGDTVRYWIGDASKENEKSNWIDAEKAYYDYGKHTPMGYGYSAYEVEPDEDSIYDFDQVILRINEGKTMRESYIQEKMLMMKDDPEKVKALEEKLEKERSKKEDN
ncbi:MAG: hypothetical protein ABFS32_08805 [Bacteroidota bacterium]